MKTILLTLLHLTGWHLSTCLFRRYHYVADAKNWTEAQTYCRQIYVDLATIDNYIEMNRLLETVPSVNYSEVWIGLYSKIDWRWSDRFTGTGADYRNWENNTNEPDFYGAQQTCVSIGDDGGWRDDLWYEQYPFICNNGTQLEPEFVLVNESTNFTSATSFCRQNFTDLATVWNDTENHRVQNLVPSGGRAWIGLYRGNPMYWSDKNRFIFGFYDYVANPIGSMRVICGVSALQHSGRFKFLSCETNFPFVCYSLPPPVKKRVVKLRLKPDPAVDLNDPTVKAEILIKLQERLKERGMREVTLKWREQPDGEVFHKEEE